MITNTFSGTVCPDCGVKPGEPHDMGCDVERCSVCNGQHLGCGHLLHDPSLTIWTGEWPGVAECRELGWYSYADPDGDGPYWKSCDADHPDASADLNRWASHNIKDVNSPSHYDYESTMAFVANVIVQAPVRGVELDPRWRAIHAGELPLSQEALTFLDLLDECLRGTFEAFPEIFDV